MLRIIGLFIVINRLIPITIVPTGAFALLCSPQKLGDILGLVEGDVRRCLMDMRSVVNVRDNYCDIQIYHKSFPDFLLDPSRSKEFHIKLEDDMYHRIYSHIIRTSQHRETILQILGQVIIARTMPSDVDFFGTPANSLSPNRLTSIFGLGHDGLGSSYCRCSLDARARRRRRGYQDSTFLIPQIPAGSVQVRRIVCRYRQGSVYAPTRPY